MKRREKRKKWTALIGVFMLLLLVSACGNAAKEGSGEAQSEAQSSETPETTEKGDPVHVKIAITTPDDIIWDAVKKKALEDYNIEIETICFSNVNLNQVLADKEVDLNAFQHYAYFEQNIKDLGLDLVSLGDMYIFRLDVYSEKYKSLDELPDGAQIAVPNDVVNVGRSLKVFEEAGLITLKKDAGNSPTVEDIESNPKNLEFVEIEHSQIVRSLSDVDAGIVFVKDAVDAGLDPSADPIYVNEVNLEDQNLKQYINLIACRAEDQDNQVYQEVVEAFHSQEVADAIQEQFQGAAIPAFDVKK